MNVLDLFSGIGGFSLGLERAGMKTVAFCEIEEFPRKVLKKHWPNIPIYEDVRELNATRLAADGITGIDVICGGFPCQDISVAGKGAGIDGARSGLWREYARLIGEIRPEFVIVENVAALLGRGMSKVLGDLAEIGYDAEWHCIPASAVGARHRRDRVWIVAHADAIRLQVGSNVDRNSASEDEKSERGAPLGISKQNVDANTDRREFSLWRQVRRMGWFKEPISQNNRWQITVEPVLCGGNDGVPNRIHRLRALGNAVVPQIPEIIGRAIMESAA